MYVLHILYILGNRSIVGIYCTILYTILERLGVQMWTFNHDRTHRSTGTCGPSQSGRLQVGRPPLLLHRHCTGPRPQDRAIGPAGHSSYTVRGHCPWRDRTQSPKHWRVRAAPVRKTSSWAAPAAQAVPSSRYRPGQPQDRTIGPAGHYAVRGHGSGRHHDQTHRSPGLRVPSQSGSTRFQS